MKSAFACTVIAAAVLGCAAAAPFQTRAEVSGVYALEYNADGDHALPGLFPSVEFYDATACNAVNVAYDSLRPVVQGQVTFYSNKDCTGFNYTKHTGELAYINDGEASILSHQITV